MVAAVTARKFEKRGLTCLHGPPVPRQMGGGCIQPRRRQGNNGRIVPPVIPNTGDARVHNVRHQIIFAHARGRFLDSGFNNLFRDTCGLANEPNFLIGLDKPLPIHNCRRIVNCGILQLGRQHLMRFGRVIVILHLNTNPRPFKTTRTQLLCKVLHRMIGG